MDEREAERILEKFVRSLDQSVESIEDLSNNLVEMQEVLSALGEQDELKESYSVKSEARRGADLVRDIVRQVRQLERELSDTERKFNDIRW